MIHVCVSEKHLSGVEAGSVASPLRSTRVKGRLGTVRGGTPAIETRGVDIVVRSCCQILNTCGNVFFWHLPIRRPQRLVQLEAEIYVVVSD